ncbi:hypothetical protein [Providencia rettgeri]|uniref:hypothetical protein n=1 Tax=Providencia rettgeri TaxID=587 RepID=UPI000807FDFB|nr:hypothetical protein [Providencia rettgeri]MDL9989463.1 hypothetical protein [Providencia rettgeri]OBY34623.1 hypothetical protein PR729_23705 [Providencia rettgeri]
MLNKFTVGLLLVPFFSFAGMDITDGNYQCHYSSIEQGGKNGEKLKGAEVYIENGDEDSILFIVSFPGGVSINPPVASKVEQTSSAITYQSKDENGNVFIVGSTKKDGLVSAIGVKNNLLHASTFIFDCVMLRNLENPVSTK